jgi:hypothetical protein
MNESSMILLNKVSFKVLDLSCQRLLLHLLNQAYKSAEHLIAPILTSTNNHGADHFFGSKEQQSMLTNSKILWH